MTFIIAARLRQSRPPGVLPAKTARHLKPFLVRVVQIHESSNIVAMAQVELLFALLEALLRGGIIGNRAVEGRFAMGAFFDGGFFNMRPHPIADLAVDK